MRKRTAQVPALTTPSVTSPARPDDSTSSSTAFPSPLIVSCDVGQASIHFYAPGLTGSPFTRTIATPNASRPLRATLTDIRSRAESAGIGSLLLVFEPTGVYDRNLQRIATQLGFEFKTVNPEHVVKARAILFGDRGKSDNRDPIAIEDVARRGRLITPRPMPEVYQLMHGWAKIYQDAEDGIITTKNRIHRALTLLFPDFDFKSDFLYDPSGRAILRCFGLNPHRIVPLCPSRILERLRRYSNIRPSSVRRLLDSARASVEATPGGRLNELAEQAMKLAWEELELHEKRRTEARTMLESLYDEARAEDPKLPAPIPGMISQVMFARLVAETGPLDNFDSWRQVLRLGGINLFLRTSGKMAGQTRISRKGKPQLRRILNIIALSLSKKTSLYGDYYQQKTAVQKMPGDKAMMAVSRKVMKMIWGLYRSGAAFDPARVFACESVYARAA